MLRHNRRGNQIGEPRQGGRRAIGADGADGTGVTMAQIRRKLAAGMTAAGLIADYPRLNETDMRAVRTQMPLDRRRPSE
ncbi:MAG: DUF433 domain-containing protein [Proteobacteria bacterium]|nr:DUF433 domain-containing protein [Pseudomonadota bacterium]